jgi:hypothetical protein
MTGANRFIDVTPAAIWRWIGQPERSFERDLVEHLLWRNPTRPINFHNLANAMERPIEEIARGIFALNRQNALVVDIVPPASLLPLGLQRGLQCDIEQLESDNVRMMLAGQDGLCLAASEVTEVDTLAPSITLFFCLDKITIFADGPLDRGNTTWVSLARRLLHACGALSFGRMNARDHH